MKWRLFPLACALLALTCGGLELHPTPAGAPATARRPDGAIRLSTPPSGASDQNPAFSPNGACLVFTRFENGYNAGPAGLFLLGLSSGEIARLAPVEDQDNVNLPGSCWNAATDRITFASDRQDTDEVWTMTAACPEPGRRNGSDLFRVTHHTTPGYYIEPSFSPDGQWIVFESDTDAPEDQQQGSIWKVRADGTGLTQLTDGPGGGTDDRLPNWSPQGDRILFQRRVPGPSTSPRPEGHRPEGSGQSADDWNLYTMATDGSDIRPVTTAPSSDTDASWSPDGRWIVYSSDFGGLPVPNIFIIPAEGGRPIRVTRDDTHEDGAPSWSPDGKWIAFESHAGQDEDTSSTGSGQAPSALWRIAVGDEVRDSWSSSSGWWQPPVNTSWQWQLTEPPIDQSFDVDMYDVDMFDNDANTVAALHAQGRKVICYISVGSWEDWRPDADQFPPSVIGNEYDGWPGEKWLDIRQIDLLAPVMRARLDQCKAKGFDGVEPDNIDSYIHDTGFPLTYQDQLNYNIWLANEAHVRGLSIGLKNDGDQAEDLLLHFDWAMIEDCFADDWCEQVEPFVAAGRAVFAAEYTDQMTANQFLSQVCPQAQAMNFNAILKNRGLDAWRQACP